MIRGAATFMLFCAKLRCQSCCDQNANFLSCAGWPKSRILQLRQLRQKSGGSSSFLGTKRKRSTIRLNIIWSEIETHNCTTPNFFRALRSFPWQYDKGKYKSFTIGDIPIVTDTNAAAGYFGYGGKDSLHIKFQTS